MRSDQIIGDEYGAGDAPEPILTAYPNRETHLGSIEISRALPIRERRLVGPWCFLDRFGPLAFKNETPMAVPPHPHIGLQTVSWLLEGEILHTDSLNSEAILTPGGVNVMTAGKGIAHAEETPPANSGRLNGVQLWVALPDNYRHTHPSFVNIKQVPVIETRGALIHLIAGTLAGITSPAPYYSEIIGMEVQVRPHASENIEQNPLFEHALLLLDGDCSVETERLEPKVLYYLGTGRECLSLNSQSGCRVLVIGGPPFPEKILMWWNFVARTPEEIRQARDDWEQHRHFGQVSGTKLHRLPAPELTRFASPNPLS